MSTNNTRRAQTSTNQTESIKKAKCQFKRIKWNLSRNDEEGDKTRGRGRARRWPRCGGRLWPVRGGEVLGRDVSEAGEESQGIHFLTLHVRTGWHIYLLAHLGWVDFDFGCSTLCLILPGLMGNFQNWLSSWARWWNIPNQSQLNPGSPGDMSPCN